MVMKQLLPLHRHHSEVAEIFDLSIPNLHNHDAVFCNTNYPFQSMLMLSGYMQQCIIASGSCTACAVMF